MVLLRPRSSRAAVPAKNAIRGHTFLFVNAMIFLLFFARPVVSVSCDEINVDDGTCIVDRSAIGPIKAIVHGTKNDPFWQQVQAGMKQTAQDLDIELEMILFDEEDPTSAMLEEIQRYTVYANSDDGNVNRRLFAGLAPTLPAALIVSLPGDSRVEDELQKFQNSIIPVFGINAIGSRDVSSFLAGTVSMDETEAGVMAGKQIRNILISNYQIQDTGVSNDMEIGESGVTGIYINHRSDVHALVERFDALNATTKDVIEWWEIVHVDEQTTEEEFTAIFEGCQNKVIQLAGGSGTADAVMSALVANGCNIEEDHIVGTFDTSTPLIYDAIAEGTIKYAVSQQPYLQGSNSVLMAALYASTGQKLTGAGPSANPSNVQTGPILITPENDNFPSKEQQACEIEGFPVCSSDGSDRTSTSTCPCTDRSDISISVITHDESSDFWDTVFSGISQAATDFGVSIQKNRFKRVRLFNERASNHREPRVSRLKHTFDINEACQSESTDGLIVSLPDASMKESLARCVSREIPYLAINAVGGLNDDILSGDKGVSTGPSLQYIGQKDFESGFEAGKRLLEAGVKQGWCIAHANFDTIMERCSGMERAFSEVNSEGSNVEYMGVINVLGNDDVDLYKSTVEGEIGKDDWSGVGVLSTGRAQIAGLLSLLEDHPEMLAGTFDLDSSLYSKGDYTLPDQIVFGIDQNAFIEGYLSVATMVWRISTSETSTTTTLETGPNFVVQSDLSKDQNTECRSNSIKFCDSTPPDLDPVQEDVESTNEKESLPKYPSDYKERPLKLTGRCEDLGRPCEICEGDCEDDTDCVEGSVCFIRDSKTKHQDAMVPGCNTNPIEWTAKDFCVDARLYECKDDEEIIVRVGQLRIARTCAYVAEDTNRCNEFGRYCKETCGYCRKGKDEGRETDY